MSAEPGKPKRRNVAAGAGQGTGPAGSDRPSRPGRPVFFLAMSTCRARAETGFAQQTCEADRSERVA